MLRKTHIIVGLIGLIVFVLQGQYMDIAHGHLAQMEDGPRMLYRSSHIYFLLASLLNVVLGAYMSDESRREWPLVRIGVSAVVILAPISLLIGFFLEPGIENLARPYSRLPLYALFGVGVVLSILSVARWLKGSD